MFLTYGVLALISVAGYAFRSPIVLVGFIAWGPVLGAAVFLLGLLFWRDYIARRKMHTA